MSYPAITDTRFVPKLYAKKELFTKKESCLLDFQRFAANYINPLTQYDSVLLNYATGLGKTQAAIAIAENFIKKGQKALVIIKNDTIAANFMHQLKFVCSKYTTQKERESIASGDADLDDRINRKIHKNYKFINFDSFTNKILGRKDPVSGQRNQPAKPLSASSQVIIVDEVHNAFGNDRYFALKQFLGSSTNYRLVLLSATPIYDNIKEAFELANLLTKTANFPIRDSLLSAKLITSAGYKKDTLIDDAQVYKLTEKGASLLIKALKGKVIMLKADTSTFPTSTEIGQNVKVNNYTTALKVVSCKMSPFQKDIYMKHISDTSLSGHIQNYSSMVYPDGSTAAKGFEKYVYSRDKSILLAQNIRKYSTKLAKLLENLGRPGKHFIYSSIVNYDGIELISNVLQVNGLGSFRIITGDTTEGERAQILAEYNSVGNKNGTRIKVLLGSDVLSEGLTLKDVLNVHIYDSPWNVSSIEQVVGRAIRNNSHVALPLSERHVDIFKYVAVTGTSDTWPISYDVSRYIHAERKDRTIKAFFRLLLETSFTCSMYKNRNSVRGFLDGSKECEYTSCNYTCKDLAVLTQADIGSFTLDIHDPELFQRIYKLVSQLFIQHDTYSLDDIISLARSPKSPKSSGSSRSSRSSRLSNGSQIQDILYILYYFITKKVLIKKPDGSNVHLTNIGDYITTAPVISKINVATVITSPTGSPKTARVRRRNEPEFIKVQGNVKYFSETNPRGTSCKNLSIGELRQVTGITDPEMTRLKICHMVETGALPLTSPGRPMVSPGKIVATSASGTLENRRAFPKFKLINGQVKLFTNEKSTGLACMSASLVNLRSASGIQDPKIKRQGICSAMHKAILDANTGNAGNASRKSSSTRSSKSSKSSKSSHSPRLSPRPAPEFPKFKLVNGLVKFFADANSRSGQLCSAVSLVKLKESAKILGINPVGMTRAQICDVIAKKLGI